MKKIMLVIVTVLIIKTGYSQSVNENAVIHQRIIAQAQSVFQQASWEIFRLKENIMLAKLNKLPKDEVVKQYNKVFENSVFKRLAGEDLSLKSMDKQLKGVGDMYITLKYYQEISRLSKAEGVEPYFAADMQSHNAKTLMRMMNTY